MRFFYNLTCTRIKLAIFKETIPMPPVAAHIATAALFMASLGVMLAAILAYANRRLYVYQDPRIGEVDQYLPHANCGACGKPGCGQFAEAVVAGEVDPGRCTVNSADMNQAIADLLGVEVIQHEKVVARLACAGGTHVAYTRARYAGLQTCRAAAVAGGGGKGCAWGCIGLGDCQVECEFDAISMNKFSLQRLMQNAARPVVTVLKCVQKTCSPCSRSATSCGLRARTKTWKTRVKPIVIWSVPPVVGVQRIRRKA
jgi:Na+-translocating ferredoxin:NAD+ oxidoreductase RNF subunit RnfB